MGQSESTFNTEENQKTVTLMNSEFVPHKQVSNTRFGDKTQILKHKQKPYLVALREIKLNTIEELKTLYSRNEKRQDENILKFLAFEKLDQPELLCGSRLAYKTYFQFYEQTIGEFVKEKKGQKIEETLLWRIMLQFLTILGYSKIPIIDFDPNHIFLTPDLCVKVLPNGNLLEDKNIYSQFVSKHSSLILSPEQLSAAAQNSLVFPQENQLVSDVFSLGILMLSLTTRCSYDTFYDYPAKQVKTDIINQLLHENLTLYTRFYINYLKILLKSNGNERPSSIALYTALSPYQEHILNLQPFTPNAQQIQNALSNDPILKQQPKMEQSQLISEKIETPQFQYQPMPPILHCKQQSINEQVQAQMYQPQGQPQIQQQPAQVPQSQRYQFSLIQQYPSQQIPSQPRNNYGSSNDIQNLQQYNTYTQEKRESHIQYIPISDGYQKIQAQKSFDPTQYAYFSPQAQQPSLRQTLNQGQIPTQINAFREPQ